MLDHRTPARRPRHVGPAISLALLALAGCGGGGDDAVAPTEAAAGAKACGSRANNTFNKLLECVTLGGVRAHQAALQAIADANGGTRVSGAPGYDASADYAERVLRNAGYVVTRQSFQFQTFVQLSPPLLEQVAPAPGGPIVTNILAYSGSGDVTAAVTALPGPAVDRRRGCEAADFAGFPGGNIALVSRGSCTFAIKATNAAAAGALGCRDLQQHPRRAERHARRHLHARPPGDGGRRRRSASSSPPRRGWCCASGPRRSAAPRRRATCSPSRPAATRTTW